MAAGSKVKDRTSVPARPVPTFDHLTKKKPFEIRDWIPLDDTSAEAVDEARRELGAAELLGNKERAEEAKKKLEAAVAEARANSVELVFRAVPRPVYEQLQRDCPPTDKQIKEFKEQYGPQAMPEHDAEKFAPLLIAASCVQPEMTPEQVESLIEDYGWSAAEYAYLFQLALRVNSTRRTIDLDF